MTASTGVISLSSANRVATRMRSAPMPTPITAVTTGIDAATKDPKVSSRTMNATPNPINSLVVLISIGSPKPGPPASTCKPASRPMSMAALTTSRSSCVTVIEDSAPKLKVVNPILASSDNVRTL